MRYAEETRVLLEAARETGQLLLKYFGQGIEALEKGRLDLVTEADLQADRLIRDRILAAFPDDAITAEESGAAGESSRRWYIDPLDGTTNFAHGVPTFAVCIAFADSAGVQSSVVYNPVNRDCFTAVRGAGAFLNGLPIHSAGHTLPSESLIFVNPGFLRYPDRVASWLNLYSTLGAEVQAIVNIGSMGLALCWVGQGILDAAVSPDMDFFSTPASSLVMQEAGIQVTELPGVPRPGTDEPSTALYHPASPSLLAANPALHEALSRLLVSSGEDANGGVGGIRS